MHILSFPINKKLRCIRDLRGDHIPLLEHMKKVTIETITKIYKLYESQLKIFVHYDPSTYHLHIHFMYIEYIEGYSSVEYSHEINSVIYNLSIDNDYYKKIVLNKFF